VTAPVGNRGHDAHRGYGELGFLGLNLVTDDGELKGYQATILKGLGVLDEKGNFTPLLDVVKAGDMVRLDKADFDAERKRITDVCRKCHTPSFVEANMKNADLMIKASDKIFAEAINIVAGLYKDGIIKKKTNQATFPYPDLLTFYEVNTHVEQLLYEMFMDFRMKTYQAAFHFMPDYTTWYGYAKMKEALVEMKKEAAQMRLNAAKKCPRQTNMKDKMKKMMKRK